MEEQTAVVGDRRGGWYRNYLSSVRMEKSTGLSVGVCVDVVPVKVK